MRDFGASVVATRSPVKVDLNGLRQSAAYVTQNGLVKLPGFRARVERFYSLPPSNAARSPILTDDYAPVEGLAAGSGKAE